MNARFQHAGVPCLLLICAGAISLAPATACAQSAPRNLPSFVRTPDVLPPSSGEIGGGTIPSSPGPVPSMPPLFMKLVEAGVDAGEEATKGTAYARELLSAKHKNLTDARKIFKHSKEDATKFAKLGEHIGILDKIADRMSVAGAASSAFSIDDNWQVTFHPEHVDGIGVVQEGTNNWLSGMAVYYGAKGGAIAGAELGAMTGIPILALVGGTVGGLAGGIGTSMLYNETGKVLVDGAADRANALRGSENLEKLLARFEGDLQMARIMFGDARFKDAEKSAKEVQWHVTEVEPRMAEAGLGVRARRLKFDALELQGRIARMRLEHKPAPPANPDVAELRPAAPKAASQLHFQKVGFSNDPGLRRQAQVTGLIDLEALSFQVAVNGVLLDKTNFAWASFQIDFTGPYQGNDTSGAFAANTSFRIHNRHSGRSGPSQNASIKGELRGRTVKLTITTPDTVDEVTIPVQ